MVSQGAGFRIQGALNKSLERLSTGLRINRASDDAAGLSISEELRTQVRGGETAKRNTTDAIAFLKVAEGALNEITSCLQRMRELAVQGANDTYTRTERSYMELEYEALRHEIDRITHSTQYNGITLLEKNTGTGGGEDQGYYSNATTTIQTVPNIGFNPLSGVRTISYEEGAVGDDTTGGRVFSFQIGPNEAAVAGSAATYDLYDSNNMLNIALPDMSLTAIFLQQGLPPGPGPVFRREDAQMFDHKLNEAAVTSMRYAKDGLTTVYLDPPGPVTEYVYMTANESALNTIGIIDGNGSRGMLPGGEGAGEIHVTGLRRVNAVRSYIGSLINRLEHSLANLENQTQNTQAAESTIRDVDFAVETSEFTRNQILSQSSLSVLSQANLMPKMMLSLLS